MKHKTFTKLIAAFLAVLILVCPGVAVSGATDGTSTASSVAGTSSNSLTDILSAIKYTEYLKKNANFLKSKDGELPPAVEVVLKGDDLFNYAEDLTNAYHCDCTSTSCTMHITGTDGERVDKFVIDEKAITHEGQIAILQVKDGVKCIYLPNEGTVAWRFNLPEKGKYNISLRYYANDGESGEESKTTSIERSLYLNGRLPFYEARFLTLTKVWVDDPASYNQKDGEVEWVKDASGNLVPKFKTDNYGNEIKADKIQKPEWRTYTCMDSTGYETEPLLFFLDKGETTLSLEAQREAMYVSEIKVTPVEGKIGESSLMSYDEYYEYYTGLGAVDYNGDSIRLQAEYPSATSENTIYATNDRTSAITQPQDAAIVYMNTIGGDGGEKWQTYGQWVRYTVDVPQSGFYNIVLRFKQSVLEGTFSSRTLRVKLAGEDEAVVPFEEAYNLQFNYNDDWQVKGLNSGKGDDGKVRIYRIYLKEGKNDIEFEASFGNMANILKRVSQSLTTVNDIYIKILRITGATPDSNRDYGFYDLMRDDVEELTKQSEELFKLAKEFEEITGTAGSHSKTLETVARLLKKMGAKESNIAKNLGNLKSNLGTLGTWLQTSMSQPLQLDFIQLQDPTLKSKPEAVEGFFSALWYEICMFFASFTTDYNNLGVIGKVKEEDKIVVWTTLGRDQAQIIRNLITNGYNSQGEGRSAVLELVAGGSLIPSILAGVGPDISMGHGSGDVINWAIRSAVVGIDEMEGYDEVTSWFSPSAIVPLTLRELFWQKDVSQKELAEAYEMTAADLAAYWAYDANRGMGDNLTLGQYAYQVALANGKHSVKYHDTKGTVDEADDEDLYYKETVYGLPETQSFSMLFYRADIFMDLGIQAPTTWEELLAIVPKLQANHMEVAFPTSLGGLNLFLYQMGGELYGDDGREIAIDTDLGLSAFEYLCQFFEQYRFPISYDFANRFRSGEIPIGIMDYTSYTHLSVYATEIKGLWQFVPLPAYVVNDAETGEEIWRNNNAVSGVSAIIMVRNENRPAEKDAAAWEFMKWYVSAETQTTYANELTALLGSVSKHNTANVTALESLPWTTTEKNNLLAQFDNLSAVPEYPGSYIISRYVNFAFLAVYNKNADAADSLQEYIIEINKELTRKRQEFGMAYTSISFSKK